MQVLVPVSHVPPNVAQSVARFVSAVFTPVSRAVKFAFTSSASAVVPFVNVFGTDTGPVVSAAFTPSNTASKLSFIASASATEPLVKVFGTNTVCASATDDRRLLGWSVLPSAPRSTS